MNVFSFTSLSHYPMKEYLTYWTGAGWGAELVCDGQQKNMCFCRGSHPSHKYSHCLDVGLLSASVFGEVQHAVCIGGEQFFNACGNPQNSYHLAIRLAACIEAMVCLIFVWNNATLEKLTAPGQQ